MQKRYPIQFLFHPDWENFSKQFEQYLENKQITKEGRCSNVSILNRKIHYTDTFVKILNAHNDNSLKNQVIFLFFNCFVEYPLNGFSNNIIAPIENSHNDVRRDMIH